MIKSIALKFEMILIHSRHNKHSIVCELILMIKLSFCSLIKVSMLLKHNITCSVFQRDIEQSVGSEVVFKVRNEENTLDLLQSRINHKNTSAKSNIDFRLNSLNDKIKF